jgi:hypothetical protein
MIASDYRSWNHGDIGQRSLDVSPDIVHNLAAGLFLHSAVDKQTGATYNQPWADKYGLLSGFHNHNQRPPVCRPAGHLTPIYLWM